MGHASLLLPPEVETSTLPEEKSNEAQTFAASDNSFQETVDIIGTSGAENNTRSSGAENDQQTILMVLPFLSS